MKGESLNSPFAILPLGKGLVERRPTDTKCLGYVDFLLSFSNHLPCLFNLLIREGWLTASVLPCGLGKGNALPLALPYHRTLELCHSADYLELETLERIVLPCKGEPLLCEGDAHPAADQLLNEVQQVLKIPSKSVDAVDVQGVTFPQVVQACL